MDIHTQAAFMSLVQIANGALNNVKEVTKQRDELLAALKHLYHNAYKSGADMGLALDFAKEAIAKADLTQ